MRALLRVLPPALLCLFALAAAGVSARPEETKSALEADPSGWKDIMPGPVLAGWTRLPLPAPAPLGKQQWKVDPEQKLLICEGDGGHDWLRYDRELGDFIYHVEWRFTPVPGGQAYNSGIYARNSADAKIWHQAQVGPGRGGFIFGDTLVGGEVKRVNLSGQLSGMRVKGPGEWNVYEIRAEGPRLSVWVNGEIVNEFKNCEVARGYVGVEGEGWRIEFKNLKLKELGGSAGT